MTQELTIYEEDTYQPERDRARTIKAWLEQWVTPEARALELDDPQDGVEVLKEIKAYGKQLDEEEKRATGPLNQSLQVIRGWFAPGKQLAKQGVLVWQQKILEAQTRRKREAEEALRLTEQKLREGDTKGAMQAHAEIRPTAKLQGVTERKIWKWEVVDLANVPAAFLAVDAPALTAEMRRQLERYPGEVPSVDGVRFWQEETLATKRG